MHNGFDPALGQPVQAAAQHEVDQRNKQENLGRVDHHPIADLSGDKRQFAHADHVRQ